MKYKSEMLKIKKFSHNLKIVMNVFYWAAVNFACGTFIAAIVIKFMPDTRFVLSEGSINHMGFSLDGFIKYRLNEMVLSGTSMKDIYFTIMIMSFIIASLILPVLRQFVLILKTVEEDKPFAIENAKRISIIGVVLMIGAFIIPAAEIFVANVVIDTMKIQNIETNYSVSIELILAGFLMFVLGGIFKYGSYLQHEYDETV